VERRFAQLAPLGPLLEYLVGLNKMPPGVHTGRCGIILEQCMLPCMFTKLQWV